MTYWPYARLGDPRFVPAIDRWDPATTCWTCRREPAAWEAVATDRSGAWLVCARCREEGHRLHAAVGYRPITEKRPS